MLWPSATTKHPAGLGRMYIHHPRPEDFWSCPRAPEEILDVQMARAGGVMDVAKPYEFIGFGPWMSPNPTDLLDSGPWMSPNPINL